MVNIRLPLGTIESFRISIVIHGGTAQPISVDITQARTACALQIGGDPVSTGHRSNTVKNSKGVT